MSALPAIEPGDVEAFKDAREADGLRRIDEGGRTFLGGHGRRLASDHPRSRWLTRAYTLAFVVDRCDGDFLAGRIAELPLDGLTEDDLPFIVDACLDLASRA